jgi:rare lipoprotein A
MKYLRAIILVTLSIGLLSCTAHVGLVKQDTGKPYCVKGKTYVPLKKVAVGHVQKGIASWYGPGFHGKKTSSGEKYDMYSLTAAHNVLPMNTLVKVTNLANNKAVVVRINDRGPFIDDRIIDLSYGAARELGMLRPGTAPVHLAVLDARDTAKPTQYVAQAPKPSPVRAPNPFYPQSSMGLLALSRN